MAVIFAASSVPNVTELPGGMPDYGAHFAGYALLGGLVLRAMAGAAWRGVTGASAARAWLFSAVYGATDEWHQHFVVGRSPALSDWLADAAGAAVMILAVWWVAARRVRGIRAV
jgi:VanZ family protein